MEYEFDWMNETIERVPTANWMYKLLCFFTGRRKRKMTYKEMYVFLREMNKESEDADKLAFKKVIEIYRFQNNNVPMGI